MIDLSAMSTIGLTSARRRMELSVIAAIARKEIRDSLRNRWFILYTVAFAVLALALAWLSRAGTGSVGLAGFGRTAASLINLVMIIIPLMALTAGATSLASERERGTLAYLLAQPVSRVEVVLGKYLGLAAALLGSIAAGFGISGLAIAIRSGSSEAIVFLRLVVAAYALALAMLAVGFVISSFARRTSSATGAALFLWLALVFLGDLGLMGTALAFRLGVQDLFHLSLINPLQVFRMAALESVSASMDVLGPAGQYATAKYGTSLPWIFVAVLAAWIAVPMALAHVIFLRKSIG